jgi:hypothetical protein
LKYGSRLQHRTSVNGTTGQNVECGLLTSNNPENSKLGEIFGFKGEKYEDSSLLGCCDM